MKHTILITGAGTGIGKDAAFALARRGHRVIATTETEEQATALRDEVSKQRLEIEITKLDITQPGDIAAAVKYKPDILVNNAGHGESGPLSEISMQRARHIFDINFFGTLDVTQQFVKHMLEQRCGRIITVTSTAGLIVVPYLGIYHSTKYALEGAFDAFRLELEPRGIKVSMIEPGLIYTGFNERMAETKYAWWNDTSHFADDIGPMHKYDASLPGNSYTTAPIVKAIVHAVESRRPRARYVEPAIYWYIIRSLNLLPARLKDWIIRRAYGL